MRGEGLGVREPTVRCTLASKGDMLGHRAIGIYLLMKKTRNERLCRGDQSPPDYSTVGPSRSFLVCAVYQREAMGQQEERQPAAKVGPKTHSKSTKYRLLKLEG